MTKTTPTIAELEAALERKRFQYEMIVTTLSEQAPAVQEDLQAVAHIYEAARIALRALKAKAAGAKMVGVEWTEEMALQGLMAFTAEVEKTNGPADTDAKYSELEMKEVKAMRFGRQLHNSGEINAAFRAAHKAAVCQLEGEI